MVASTYCQNYIFWDTKGVKMKKQGCITKYEKNSCLFLNLRRLKGVSTENSV